MSVSRSRASLRLLVPALLTLFALVAGTTVPAALAQGQGQGQNAGGSDRAANPNAGAGNNNGRGSGAQKPANPNAGAGNNSGRGSGAQKPANPNAGAGNNSGQGGSSPAPANPNSGPGNNSGQGNPAPGSAPANPNSGPGNNSGQGNPAPGTPRSNAGNGDAQNGNGGQGRAEGRGRQRVTLCHATGSDSNPYSQITIASPALPAHLRQGALYPVPAEGCPGGRDGVERVTLCHATGSDSNPYVQITIASPALPAHLRQGGIYPVPADGCPGDAATGGEATDRAAVCVPTGDADDPYTREVVEASELPALISDGAIHPIPADGCGEIGVLRTVATGGGDGPDSDSDPALLTRSLGGGAAEDDEAATSGPASATAADTGSGPLAQLPFTGLGLLGLLGAGAALALAGWRLRSMRTG